MLKRTQKRTTVTDSDGIKSFSFKAFASERSITEERRSSPYISAASRLVACIKCVLLTTVTPSWASQKTTSLVCAVLLLGFSQSNKNIHSYFLEIIFHDIFKLFDQNNLQISGYLPVPLSKSLKM